MVGALALLFYNNNRISEQKKEAIALERELQEGKDPNANLYKEIDKKIEDNKYENRADIIEKDTAIGVIRIADIGVVIPIYDNTNPKSLIHGSGVVDTTDLPSSAKNTTCVLAGHRGGKNEHLSFINIDRLKNGSVIKITTRDQVLFYEVYGQEVIEPTDWSKFTREEDKTKLFLMACHPYPKNDKRLLVESELKKVINK